MAAKRYRSSGMLVRDLQLRNLRLSMALMWELVGVRSRYYLEGGMGMA
jgi:hypothetical protein